jgi:hypothetical protein
MMPNMSSYDFIFLCMKGRPTNINDFDLGFEVFTCGWSAGRHPR